MLITSSILLLICLFSLTLYMNIEKKMVAYEYNNANNLLQQIKFNIETVDGIIQDEAVRTYFKSDVTNLMYAGEDDMDIADYVERVNNIARDVILDKFVYSMYVYNSTQNEVFPVIGESGAEDMDFMEGIKAGRSYPKLKPIIREIMLSDHLVKKKEMVITYIMYQTVDKDNKMDGAVILNIKADWLMGNLKQIHSAGEYENVYIIDGNGNFLNPSPKRNELEEAIRSIFTKEAFGGKTGILEERIEGVQYFISYTSLQDTSIMLIKTQSMDIVMRNIENIKKTIILVTAIFILVAVIISMTISGRIYKPVRNLLNQVKVNENKVVDTEEAMDEMVYLQKVYGATMERIRDFDRKKMLNEDIIKSYWLQRCLTDGIDSDLQKFSDLVSENGFQIKLDGNFAVLVFKIDDYMDFSCRSDILGKNTLKYAIMQLIKENISEKYRNECIDPGYDQIVVILNNLEGPDPDFFASLGSYTGKIQENLKKYYDISVTVSVSGIASGIGSLPELYSTAVANSVYRFAFGKSAYITPELIDSNMNHKQLSFLDKQEEKLLETIRNNNIEKAEKALFEIISFLKGQEYSIMFASMFRLSDSIKGAIEQVSGSTSPQNRLIYTDLLKRITTLETIDEFHIIILNYLKQSLMTATERDSDPRNDLIIETVKNIIMSRYHEQGLCLQEIAGMLKLKPRKLSSLFKENEKISIGEYINEIRLLQAAQLLETSRLNVNELIEKVGIVNETYFYSIFRKKFGMTPKEYTVQKNLSKLISKPMV